MGPDELSFSNTDAWKYIYDRCKDGQILIKDSLFYRTNDTIRAKHIVNTHDPEMRAKQRKMMVNTSRASTSTDLSVGLRRRIVLTLASLS